MATTGRTASPAELRPRRIGFEGRWWLATAVVALAAFAHVQDRVTAAAAVRFASEQRRAPEGAGLRVQADVAMQPAIDRSVRLGLVAAAAVVGASGVARLVALRLTRRAS